MFDPEIDQFLEEFPGPIAAGGHVRVVHPHELDIFQVLLLQFLEVGPPIVLFAQSVTHRNRFHQVGHRGIGRVARIREEDLVARVQKGHGYVEDPFFGTHQGQYLALGIQIDPVMGLVEFRNGLPQLRDALVALVAVYIRILHGPDDLVRRVQVRTAYAQVDDGLSLLGQGPDFSQF